METMDTRGALPEESRLDNLRYNDLESVRWQQHRFTGRQIKEQAVEYCTPKIVETIKRALIGSPEIDFRQSKKEHIDQ